MYNNDECINLVIIFERVCLEISSDTIFIKRDIQNSFGKIISDKSSYIYNKEINFNIKSPPLFEKEFKNNQNNKFYLYYLYFKQKKN